MRSFFKSLIVHGSWSTVVVVAMGSVHAGDMAPGSFDSTNLVGELAVMNDLEPLAETAAIAKQKDRFISARPAAPLGGVTTELRASVPAANRSRSLVGGSEVFANSKSILPLLVGDMEPVVSPVSRPMSGRLVGARPSLPLLNRVPLTRVSTANHPAE
jgi:hypothetical protein